MCGKRDCGNDLEMMLHAYGEHPTFTASRWPFHYDQHLLEASWRLKEQAVDAISWGLLPYSPLAALAS